MKGFKLLAIAACVFAVCVFMTSCEEDPARKVKVDSHPAVVPPPVVTSVVTNPPDDPSLADPKKLLEFCPSIFEKALEPDIFLASGPCALQQRDPVLCNSLQDDFLVAFTRNMEHDATLVVYMNVEFYHGPGSYNHVEMFETLQHGENIYRWSNDVGQATVGPREAYISLPKVQLEAEPMLFNCTNTLGPATNYQFQCGRRGPAMLASVVFSGKLQCLAPSKKVKE